MSLAEVVEAFVVAAERVESAGVDVHASHNYLIEQFLSPLTNHRNNAYGSSEEKPAAAARRGAVRHPLPGRAALRRGIRISGDQFTPAGLGQTDMQGIAEQVTSAFSIDFQRQLLPQPELRPGPANSILPMYVPEGRFVYLAEAANAVMDLPVFSANRIVGPRMGGGDRGRRARRHGRDDPRPDRRHTWATRRLRDGSTSSGPASASTRAVSAG